MRLFPAEVTDLVRGDQTWFSVLLVLAGAVAVLVGIELVALLLIGQALLGQGAAGAPGGEAIGELLASYPRADLLVLLAWSFAAVVVARGGCQVAYHYYAKKWARVATVRLQAGVMRSLLSAPVGALDKRRLGDMVRGVMESTLCATLAVDGMTGFFSAVFTTAMVCAVVAYLSPVLLLAGVAVGLPVVWLVINPLQHRTQRVKKRYLLRRAQATESATNLLRGIREIKALSIEQKTVDAFGAEVHQAEVDAARVRFMKALPAPLLQVIFQVAFATGIVAMVFFLSPEGLTTFLPLVGVAGYSLLRVYPAATQVSKALLDLNQALPGLRVAAEWMALPEDELVGGTAIVPREFEVIRFERVSFSYAEGEPAIVDLDLCIEIGKVTCVVGESGAGKSTLLDLLLKLRAPQQGRVLLGTQDLRHVVRQSWLREVGVVRQDVFLFAGTIRGNLLMWKPEATEDEMLRACEEAGLAAFIGTLREGLDTAIGDRGVTLSGGQRQRVAIARAVLRTPKVLILDEALGALDGETEEAVLNALLRPGSRRTVIIVSHRMTSARWADTIAVLDEGRLVEQGSHTELLRRRGRYYRLFSSQVGASELTTVSR